MDVNIDPPRVRFDVMSNWPLQPDEEDALTRLDREDPHTPREIPARLRLNWPNNKAQKIRQLGYVPAMICHGASEDTTPLMIEHHWLHKEAERTDFRHQLHTLKWKQPDGTVREEIVHPTVINIHPLTFQILTISFQKWTPGKKVKLEMPILFKNLSECAGVKVGGELVQYQDTVPMVYSGTSVRIPLQIRIDVKNLQSHEKITIDDIRLPKTKEHRLDLQKPHHLYTLVKCAGKDTSSLEDYLRAKYGDEWEEHLPKDDQ